MQWKPESRSWLMITHGMRMTLKESMRIFNVQVTCSCIEVKYKSLSLSINQICKFCKDICQLKHNIFNSTWISFNVICVFVFLHVIFNLIQRALHDACHHKFELILNPFL